MKFNSVIFDFNGTLFYDGDYHNQAWNRLSLEIRKKPITFDEMHSSIHGVPNIEAIENLLPNQFTQQEKQQLSLRKEAYYREICLEQPTLSLVEGALELFQRLQSESIPFTIASASILENIDFFFDVFNLNQWFNKTNVIYDNGTYNDKVDMFLDALSNIHGKLSDCLIFEDSESGVKNAIAAGFKNIILLHQNELNPKFNQYPEIIFHADNFKDILTFLQQN